MKKILWFTLASVLTVGSCSPQPDTEHKAQGVLTDAQKKALNDVKQVEQVLQDTDDAHRKALDEAEGK